MLVYLDYPDGDGICTGFLYPQKEAGLQYIRVMLFAFLVGVCINVSQEMGVIRASMSWELHRTMVRWKVRKCVWEPEQPRCGVL